MNSDDLAARLRTWAQTPDEQDVPEFDPAEPDLDDLVRDKGRGRFRSHGPQLTAMENHPLRQLPERFRAAL